MGPTLMTIATMTLAALGIVLFFELLVVGMGFVVLAGVTLAVFTFWTHVLSS